MPSKQRQPSIPQIPVSPVPTTIFHRLPQSHQQQLAHLRRVETNPANYHASVSGFLAEIDRMQLEVREYLSLHPTELAATA